MKIHEDTTLRYIKNLQVLAALAFRWEFNVRSVRLGRVSSLTLDLHWAVLAHLAHLIILSPGLFWALRWVL